MGISSLGSQISLTLTKFRAKNIDIHNIKPKNYENLFHDASNNANLILCILIYFFINLIKLKEIGLLKKVMHLIF